MSIRLRRYTHNGFESGRKFTLIFISRHTSNLSDAQSRLRNQQFSSGLHAFRLDKGANGCPGNRFETSFQADIDTCGLLLSLLPDTLASKAYDSYRLREIGVVYQDAVHPVANEDSLRFIAHTELYQHAIGAWETSNELQRHRLEYFGRTLNIVYIYIAYILFAFLGYLLRFKPIKKILAVFAILIVAAWIYHEINSIVQEYAKKLNTESHQIVNDTYKEIDGIRKKSREQVGMQ